MTPGAEAHIDVHLPTAADRVAAVRLWVGGENGAGALKTKAVINKVHADNHVEVPAPLPPDARLCVQLELASGEKHVGSVAIRR